MERMTRLRAPLAAARRLAGAVAHAAGARVLARLEAPAVRGSFPVVDGRPASSPDDMRARARAAGARALARLLADARRDDGTRARPAPTRAVAGAVARPAGATAARVWHQLELLPRDVHQLALWAPGEAPADPRPAGAARPAAGEARGGEAGAGGELAGGELERTGRGQARERDTPDHGGTPPTSGVSRGPTRPTAGVPIARGAHQGHRQCRYFR